MDTDEENWDPPRPISAPSVANKSAQNVVASWQFHQPRVLHSEPSDFYALVALSNKASAKVMALSLNANIH
jgi:hypothetical protein